MIVAGCPNPENASSFGTMPVSSAINRAMNATRSYRQRPQIRNTNTKNSKPNNIA